MGSILVVWIESAYSNYYLGRTLAILEAANIEFNDNKDIIQVVKRHEDIDIGRKEDAS